MARLFIKLYPISLSKIVSIMKNISIALIIAASLAACSGKQNTATVVVVDTAAIQRNAVIAEQARIKVQQDSIRIAKEAMAAQREKDNVVRHRSTHTSNVGSSETPSSSGSGTVSEADKKQGWSKAATNAAIGAGAGGLAGALIDHGKGRGTIIGGVVGAGAGYIIGRKADVKSGRVVKKTTVTTTNPE